MNPKNPEYDPTKPFNRAATIEDVKLVIQCLNEAQIPYFLIGGYALLLQGNQRITKDIDILLPIGMEVGEKIQKALLHLPQKVVKDVEPRWFSEDETIRIADEFTVDLFFKCGGGVYNYHNLLPFAEEKTFDGIPIQTINPKGLWLTKQTGREKDIPDLLFLNALLQQQGVRIEQDLNTHSFSFSKI